jgi:hypothetical protein
VRELGPYLWIAGIVIFSAASVVLDSKWRKRRAVPPADFVDAFAAIGILIVVTILLGVFEPSPHTATGPAAIGESFWRLFAWVLKALFLVFVPAMVLVNVLRRFLDFRRRSMIYGVFALLAGTGFYIAHERSDAREAAAQAAAAPAVEARLQEQQLAQDERSQVTARYVSAFTRVRDTWRADLESAGAVGEPGEIPPLLAVEERARNRVIVRNTATRPVCVTVLRAARLSDTRYERCEGFETACRELAPGAQREFILYYSGSSLACTEGRLAFQIGTPLQPEPSWWTRSELEWLATRPAPGIGAGYSTDHLRAEAAVLESLAVEAGRAQRWRTLQGLRPATENAVEAPASVNR